MRARWFLGLLFLLPLELLAKLQHRDNAPVRVDPPSVASTDGFWIQLVMTADAQRLLETWSRPAPVPHVSNATTIIRGQPIEALVFFSGCTADEHGQCVVTADYRFATPLGTTYGEFRDTEVWRDKPAFEHSRIGLAVDRAGMFADPHDPLGDYTVYVTVIDHVSKRSLRVSSTFEVIEDEGPVLLDFGRLAQ